MCQLIKPFLIDLLRFTGLQHRAYMSITFITLCLKGSWIPCGSLKLLPIKSFHCTFIIGRNYNFLISLKGWFIFYISRFVPFVLRREAENSEGIRSGRWTNQTHTGCYFSHSLLHLFYTHPGVPCRGMCDLEPMVALALTCDFWLLWEWAHFCTLDCPSKLMLIAP